MTAAMTTSRSVIARIRMFYRDRPDEELSIPQIAVKFGCKIKTVHKALQELKAEGEIESVHVVRRRSNGIAREVQA